MDLLIGLMLVVGFLATQDWERLRAGGKSLEQEIELR